MDRGIRHRGDRGNGGDPGEISLTATLEPLGLDSIGVMLESFIEPGRQDVNDPASLVYGQSITDACMDFATSVAVLPRLAAAVRRRCR